MKKDTEAMVVCRLPGLGFASYGFLFKRSVGKNSLDLSSWPG